MAGAPSRLSDTLVRTIHGFFAAAHEIAPYRLPALIASAFAELGADVARVWLADHAQRSLVHLATPPSSSALEPLSIDGTAAGRAFISREIIERSDDTGRTHLWLPLLDGVDRVGVMEVEVSADALTDEWRDALALMTTISTAEIITRGQYTDLYTQVRRQKPLSLAAEMQWQSLPPNSFCTEGVTVAGMMEPAYGVGGDCFDYAHDEHRLSFAVLDAVGHDLGASVISSLALGAYRNSRRSNRSLRETALVLDEAIRQEVGDSAFATGQLAVLDTASGIMRWINAGHPPPLLIRNGVVVGALTCRPRVPFGLRDPEHDLDAEIAEDQLEPGDSVLLYSDGVIEARRGGGEDFGAERLAQFLHTAFAAGLAPAETLRRLSNAVLDFHNGVLQDDATTLLVTWQEPT